MTALGFVLLAAVWSGMAYSVWRFGIEMNDSEEATDESVARASRPEG